MTLEQKQVIKNSLEQYKKWDIKDRVKWKEIIKDNLKNLPSHKNAIPAKVFLRVVKNK